MNIVITDNQLEFDKRAALEIVNQMKSKSNSVIGFATGNTTIGLHQELVNQYENESLDFSEITTFNLDEYAGISKENPKSCYARMDRQLFQYVNINKDKIKFLNGMAPSLEAEAKQFELQIKEVGGIDIQVLGIGTNGHIAFNEPGAPFESTTRIVDIAKQTVEGKADLFGSVDQVPKQGITMGIKNIMHARKILLLAKGVQKANIIFQSLFGPITTDVPASILQLHPNLTVVLDLDAANYIPASYS